MFIGIFSTKTYSKIQDEDNANLAPIVSLLKELAHPGKFSKNNKKKSDHTTTNNSKKDFQIKLTTLLPEDQAEGSYYFYQVLKTSLISSHTEYPIRDL